VQNVEDLRVGLTVARPFLQLWQTVYQKYSNATC